MRTKSCFVALALFTFTAGVCARTTLTGRWTDGAPIPDDPNGIVRKISLDPGISSITGVQLTLDIGGTDNYTPFNGDYYAYLLHGSTLAVLLNRVGKTSGNPDGYADAGFDVTFDSGSDIHYYQSESPVFNTAGQLTGTWAPDGGTTLASSFYGQDASGDWTLFIADMSSGDSGNLESWSLQVTDVPAVPEPATGLAAGLLVLLVFLTALLQRRHPAIGEP